MLGLHALEYVHWPVVEGGSAVTLYRATVYKRTIGSYFTGEQWSNVYTIDEVNVTEASSVAASAAIAEATQLFDWAEVWKIVCEDPNAPDDKKTQVLNYVGDRSPTGLGSALPLFNTVRCIFSDEVRRPESKYLRGVLAADNVEAGRVSGETITAVQTNYVNAILALSQIVGPSGEAFVTGSVQPAVQMRQLSWSRRPRPGFHRGWVPN